MACLSNSAGFLDFSTERDNLSPFKANPVDATTATCQCGRTILSNLLFGLVSHCRNPSSSSVPLNICLPVKMVGLHHGAISLLLAFSVTRKGTSERSRPTL